MLLAMRQVVIVTLALILIFIGWRVILVSDWEAELTGNHPSTCKMDVEISETPTVSDWFEVKSAGIYKFYLPWERRHPDPPDHFVRVEVEILGEDGRVLKSFSREGSTKDYMLMNKSFQLTWFSFRGRKRARVTLSGELAEARAVRERPWFTIWKDPQFVIGY